jgi:hypothetical protein
MLLLLLLLLLARLRARRRAAARRAQRNGAERRQQRRRVICRCRCRSCRCRCVPSAHARVWVSVEWLDNIHVALLKACANETGMPPCKKIQTVGDAKARICRSSCAQRNTHKKNAPGLLKQSPSRNSMRSSYSSSDELSTFLVFFLLRAAVQGECLHLDVAIMPVADVGLLLLLPPAFLHGVSGDVMLRAAAAMADDDDTLLLTSASGGGAALLLYWSWCAIVFCL